MGSINSRKIRACQEGGQSRNLVQDSDANVAVMRDPNNETVVLYHFSRSVRQISAGHTPKVSHLQLVSGSSVGFVMTDSG